MDPVVHFEMPYEDQKRLSAFYKSAFGWRMQATGPEMGDKAKPAKAKKSPAKKKAAPGKKKK